jgi:hypothetical protein
MNNIMVLLDVSPHFLWIWEKPRNFSKSPLSPEELEAGTFRIHAKSLPIGQNFFRVIRIMCDPCQRSMAHFQVADGRNGFRTWRVAANASYKQSPTDTM